MVRTRRVVLGAISVLLAAATAASPAPNAPRPVLVVGDSLAVGLEPSLGRLVRRGPSSGTSRQGAPRPRASSSCAPSCATSRRAQCSPSLGTNDGPHADRFRDRIRRALRAIPSGICVVWADIYRPARKGPYRPLNAVLAREARRDRRLVIVHWSRAVAEHRVTLRDDIHPDTAGFDYRSRLFARALARCDHV